MLWLPHWAYCFHYRIPSSITTTGLHPEHRPSERDAGFDFFTCLMCRIETLLKTALQSKLQDAGIVRIHRMQEGVTHQTA